MSVEADFSELGRLQTLIGGASNRVTKDMPGVLDAVATAVAQDAARRAPRDTGELQSDIGVKQKEGSATTRTRWVGSDTRQAFFQEFGTSRMPPQPWLSPAAEAGVGKLAEKLGELGEPF